MDPIIIYHPVADQVFPFEEFPAEVKLAALMRFELQDLVNYSLTNRANHQFVWLTPELLDRIITSKIIKIVQPYLQIRNFQSIEVGGVYWKYAIALAKLDLKQAIQFAMEHLEISAQITSLMEISKNEKDRSTAINTLMLAAKICKEDKSFGRAFEFLRWIAVQLAPLNSEKAFEVYEAIDDEKERLVAKAEIALHLPYDQKEKLLQEVIQALMKTSIHQFRFYPLLGCLVENVSLPVMKKLLEKAAEEFVSETDSAKYYHMVWMGGKSYYNHAKRSLPEDHHWIIWLVEQLKEASYLIRAYSELAIFFFDTDPKLAYESINKAKDLIAKNPNEGSGYAEIANAQALWDPQSAEDYYVKAIDILFASLPVENTRSTILDIERAIRGLAKVNLELALNYNEKLIMEEDRATNLLMIALEAGKVEFLDHAISRLLKVNEGPDKFDLLASEKILEFGEDFAVHSVSKIEDQKIRAQLLFKLSKKMLSSNPQRARQLAKEGMVLSLQFEKTYDKVSALFSFI